MSNPRDTIRTINVIYIVLIMPCSNTPTQPGSVWCVLLLLVREIIHLILWRKKTKRNQHRGVTMEKNNINSQFTLPFPRRQVGQLREKKCHSIRAISAMCFSKTQVCTRMRNKTREEKHVGYVMMWWRYYIGQRKTGCPGNPFRVRNPIAQSIATDQKFSLSAPHLFFSKQPYYGGFYGNVTR